MAERKRCPDCDSANCYVVKGGKIVCRSCGYDGREEKQEKPK